MSIAYTLRESFSGFQRTKLSSALSILTICISLLFLGLFGVVTLHAARFIEAIRDRVELEVFLQEPLAEEGIQGIQQAILVLDGVERVSFVSKEDAARIFREEFGENINDVLDFNPLPPSFRVGLRPAYRTAAKAQTVADRLQGIAGVESVVYRKALLEIIDRRAQTVNSLTLGLGVIISLSAIFLVSNTIRLAIYAKRKIIRTMELVGATRTFIRSPFVLEGVMQGILGGLLAAGILGLLLGQGIRLVSAELAEYLRIPTSFYILVVIGGATLGLMGSLISVTRFIRRPPRTR